MNYILTISYHNQQVAETSYSQLVNTTTNNPCKVLLLDNNCPLLLDKSYLKDLCKRLGFEYHNTGSNLGLHNGYNYLMNFLPEDCDRFIIYDGDSYPVTQDWHSALLKLMDDPRIVWGSLYNKHSYKEMGERGFNPEIIFNYYCHITHAPVTNSISCFRKSWTDSVGRFTEPMRFYGGLECAMWAKKDLNKLWVFLNDFKEDENPVPPDPIYVEYKIEHAHKGVDISLEEFIMHKKSLEIIKKITLLPGWCTSQKAIRLYEFIRDNKIKLTLEIGVYGGKSIVPIAMAHQEFGGRVIGVDPYSQSESQQVDLEGKEIIFTTDWDKLYQNTLITLFNYPVVTLYKTTSKNFISDNILKFDMIHIDGNHSKNNVINDLELILPHLTENGVIVMDDINWETVSEAIKEFGKLVLIEDHQTWGIYGTRSIK